jgi:hypothetical protein
VPDAWEFANGLNAYSAADATLDKDGDGQSNAAEYFAGTLQIPPPTFSKSSASRVRVEVP